MKTVKNMLKLERKAHFDLTIKMPGDQILEYLNPILAQKVRTDIARSNEMDVLQRRPQLFHNYLYDQSLLKFGKYSLSAENIVKMCNGLTSLEDDDPYAKVLLRIMGMTVPPFRFDEIQVVLKSIQFFNKCQAKWVKRVVNEDRMAPPTEQELNNIHNGGVCSAFEIIDELKDAFEHDRQLIDRLLSTLKPDCLTIGHLF